MASSAGHIPVGHVHAGVHTPGQAVSSMPSQASVPSFMLLPHVAMPQVQSAWQSPGHAVSSVPSHASLPSRTLFPQTAPAPGQVPAAASLTRNLLPSPVPLKVIQ